MNKPTYQQFQEGTYKFPGGFELAMFEAFAIADGRNKERLMKAFPNFFGEHIDTEIATGTASSKGDRSVGIQPQYYTFQLHRELLKDADSREWYRKEFQKVFSGVADEPVGVVFDDEQDVTTEIIQNQKRAQKIADAEINAYHKSIKAGWLKA